MKSAFFRKIDFALNERSPGLVAVFVEGAYIPVSDRRCK